MPEGHTVHRLARTLRELFGGERLRVTSPQGRFADGAALLDGRRLVAVEAWGKQLFCGFVPDDALPGQDAAMRTPDFSDALAPGRHDSPEMPGPDHPEMLWLRTHLGLYGAWTFAGAPGAAEVAHAIGAPRKRIGERETVVAGAPASAASSSAAALTGGQAGRRSVTGSSGTRSSAAGSAAAEDDVTADGRGRGRGERRLGEEWEPPAPRGQVRARLLGRHAVADLTGPAACEVIASAEKDAVTARLGPDPIRDGEPGHDAERFVARAGRSRTTIGQLLMDQAVIAGVGNIYRAETLFRAGVDPLRPGRELPAASLRAIWDDLVVLMRDGARTGAIVTTRPEDRAGGLNGDIHPDVPPLSSDVTRQPPSDTNDVTTPSAPERPPSDTDGAVARPSSRRRTRQNTDGSPDAVPAGQAFYVYHRDAQPCRICGSPVLLKELAGRNLFWCGTCQG